MKSAPTPLPPRAAFGRLAAVLLFAALAQTAAAQSAGVPWIAFDRLGRVTVAADEAGLPRKGKRIGIFYFLWAMPCTPIPQAPGTDHPYNISEILEKDPGAASNPGSPLWGGNGIYHYWAEPLFGYYRSDDPWVLRRHIQLLADAGVDFLIFDATNKVTYPEAFLPLCDTLAELRAAGETVPQVTFMVHTSAAETAEVLWKQIYGIGRYDDLLFRIDGKPLLIGSPKEIKDPKLSKALTLREAWWPFEIKNTRDAWHWEATYPQPYSWHVAEDVPEQVSVSVAQNLSRKEGTVVQMSSGRARGRSFRQGDGETVPRPELGLNFSQQWSRALELDPTYIMVTGWNEWIAGRWIQEGKYVFVDQFDQEYSRDVEMMKGGHGDSYYLQMISGIRRFKGALPLPAASEPVTIDPDGGFAQWRNVEPVFADHVGETIPRDFDGNGGTRYVNRSGRNDIVEARAARDGANLYFYLRTKDPITPEIPDGLALLLNTDLGESGWIGGDWLIGRAYDGATASLERYAGGKKRDVWKWKETGRIDYRVEGNELLLIVPFKAVRLPKSEKSLRRIAFKWLDNVPETMTPDDLYTNGDVAPESRFFYEVAKEPAEEKRK